MFVLLTLLAMAPAQAQSDSLDQCLAGDATACDSLHDSRRAQTILDEQCREEPGESCLLLAHLVRGDDLSLPRKAQRLALEGCDALGRDCGAQAVSWLEGESTPQDLPLAMVLLERACWNDDGMACARLGEQEESKRGRRNEVEITERYRKGCNLDQADACLAMARRTREGLGTIKDPLKTTLFLDAACKLGSHEGCWGSGKAWATGDGVPKDQSHGWDRLREACMLHTPRCIEGAKAFRAGEWLFPEDNHIIELYDIACQRGDNSACWTLHDLLLEGEEVPEQPFQAERLRESACSDQASCVAAFDRFTEAGDHATARQVLQAGCQASHVDLCWDLLAHADDKKPRDLELSLDTLDRLCEELEDSRACTERAERVIDGLGIEANRDAGWVLLKETCTTGYAPACISLIEHTPNRSRLKLTELMCDEMSDAHCWHQADLLLQGSKRSQTQAVELLERSCTAESGPGCRLLAEALEEGKGVEANPGRAAELRIKACELGQTEVCEEASDSGTE